MLKDRVPAYKRHVKAHRAVTTRVALPKSEQRLLARKHLTKQMRKQLKYKNISYKQYKDYVNNKNVEFKEETQ